MSSSYLSAILSKCALQQHKSYLFENGFASPIALNLLCIEDSKNLSQIPYGHLKIIINEIEQTKSTNKSINNMNSIHNNKLNDKKNKIKYADFVKSLNTINKPQKIFIFDDIMREYDDIKQKYITNWQITEKLKENINKYLDKPSSIDISMISTESIEKLQNNAIFLQKSLNKSLHKFTMRTYEQLQFEYGKFSTCTDSNKIKRDNIDNNNINVNCNISDESSICDAQTEDEGNVSDNMVHNDARNRNNMNDGNTVNNDSRNRRGNNNNMNDIPPPTQRNQHLNAPQYPQYQQYPQQMPVQQYPQYPQQMPAQQYPQYPQYPQYSPYPNASNPPVQVTINGNGSYYGGNYGGNNSGNNGGNHGGNHGSNYNGSFYGMSARNFQVPIFGKLDLNAERRQRREGRGWRRDIV